MEDAAASTQHERPVPLNQSREGQLGGLAAEGCKPFQ
jgi:hypothetical protein